MSSFHLTVTSGLLASNTTTEFTTRLPQPLTVDSDMEVALTFMQGPNRIHNVPRNGNGFTVTDPQGAISKHKIPVGAYTDCVDVMNALKKAFPPGIIISYEKPIRTFSLTVPALMRLELDYQVSRVLGYDRVVDLVGPISKQADSECNLLGDFNSIFIYSTVVSSQIVDDQTVPLLGVVPSNTVTMGKHYSPARLSYKPVVAQELDRISFELRTIRGDCIPFCNGSVCLGLHFRKRHFSS